MSRGCKLKHSMDHGQEGGVQNLHHVKNFVHLLNAIDRRLCLQPSTIDFVSWPWLRWMALQECTPLLHLDCFVWLEVTCLLRPDEQAKSESHKQHGSSTQNGVFDSGRSRFLDTCLPTTICVAMLNIRNQTVTTIHGRELMRACVEPGHISHLKDWLEWTNSIVMPIQPMGFTKTSNQKDWNQKDWLTNIDNKNVQ